MTQQIQLRRGTAARWLTVNPVLAEGEIACEIDTLKFKIGNGVAAWSALTYASGIQGIPGTNGTDGEVTLSTAQTVTNKTLGNYTEGVYSIVDGAGVNLNPTNGPIQTWVLSASRSPTATFSSGQSIILMVTAGANSVTWPSVNWTKVGGSGEAPGLTATGATCVVLWKVGSVLYGSLLGSV